MDSNGAEAKDTNEATTGTVTGTAPAPSRTDPGVVKQKHCPKREGRPGVRGGLVVLWRQASPHAVPTGS